MKIESDTTTSTGEAVDRAADLAFERLEHLLGEASDREAVLDLPHLGGLARDGAVRAAGLGALLGAEGRPDESGPDPALDEVAYFGERWSRRASVAAFRASLVDHQHDED